MLSMASVSLLKVLVAAIGGFVLGGIWYSALFGKIWMREAGVAKMPAGNPGVTYGSMFVFSFISALVFAMILGAGDIGNPIAAGALIGFGLVAIGLASNYLAAGRSMTLWLIDAAFHVLKFIVYGIVFALWR